MALFRNVRPERITNPSIALVPVVYHDSKNRIWISWPEKDEVVGDSATGCIDPSIMAQTLKKIAIDLRQQICSHQLNTAVHIHDNESFLLLRIPSQLQDNFVVPAIIPSPPVLDVTKILTSDLERRKLSSDDFGKLVAALELKRQVPFSETISLPDQPIFFGFRRYHHAVTIVNRAWQVISLEQPQTSTYGSTTGSATFRQIITRLGLYVFENISEVTDHELRHVSGASFDVTIARARGNSSLPVYEDGSSRRQWRTGSVLALKRPAIQQNSYRSDLFSSRASPSGAAGQAARVERSVINELKILSHPSLRNHPNIVHLYGIGWDPAKAGSFLNASPILVQPYANHGHLEYYLAYLDHSSKLSMNLRYDILVQILRGLRELHRCRIAHGDVKPDNILVESRGDTESPRILLADFGFSLILEPGQKEVEVAGQTKHFASPEIYRCIEQGLVTIPADEAFASDVYSFGMTALLVSFWPVNIFKMINKVDEEGGFDGSLPPLPISSRGTTMTEEELTREAKADPEAGTWFLPHVHYLLVLQTIANGEEQLYDAWMWIIQTLHWLPDRRETVFSLLEKLDDATTSSKNLIVGNEIKSTTRHLGQDMQRFFVVDGTILEFPLNEVPLEQQMQRDGLNQNYSVKNQVFADFKHKSSLLIDHPINTWQSLRLSRGLETWVSSVYAAYQVFLCHLHGYGTPRNIQMAGKYLAASAAGGYTNALALSVRFHERYPEIDLPNWSPDADGICKTLLLGFFPGTQLYNWDMRVLEQLSVDKAALVRRHINEFAFSELGEQHLDRKEHQDNSHPGPDIRYLWYLEGSVELLARLVSQCSPEQLIEGFRCGLFPEDAKSYRNETVLYMCCRNGNAALVLALFEEFEWVHGQTMVATLDGRLPLHFIYCFSAQEASMVAEILLAHGADINAVDNQGYRAIDYAISARKDDIAFWLLDRQEIPLFLYPSMKPSDILTATIAGTQGSEIIFRRCIETAGLDVKLKILDQIAEETLETRIQQSSFENVTILLESIGKISNTDFELLKDAMRDIMFKAVCCGNTDVLRSMTELLVPIDSLDDSTHTLLLTCAAIHSRLEDFEILMHTRSNWTVSHAHSVLSTIIQVCPGPAQADIAQSLLHQFQEGGIAKEVVNLHPTGCEPDCKLHSGHSYPPSLFASAILNNLYEIAAIMDEYVIHNDGYPTALYHILDHPSVNTLNHIRELMERNLEHCKYICYPIYNRSTLQVITKQNENFGSPHEVASVLQELIEYYVDEEEDLNVLDHFGVSALFYAADYFCPEAIKVLLEASADPLLPHTMKPFLHFNSGMVGNNVTLGQRETAIYCNAYEFVLFAIFTTFKTSEQVGVKLRRDRFALASLFPNDAQETLRVELVKRFDALAALSYEVDCASDLPPEFGAEDVAGGELSEWKVKGLVPRTNSVRLEVVVEEDGGAHLEVWGLFRNGGMEFSLHVATRLGMTDEDEEQKRAQHKAKYDPSDPSSLTLYAMTGISGPHLYLYLVERLPEDDGKVVESGGEAFGSGFSEDPDALWNLSRTLKQFDIDIKGKGKEQ